MAINELWHKIQHLFVARMPSILLALLIFIIGWWLIKLLYTHFTKRIRDPHVDPSIKPFFLSLILIIFRLVLILSTLQIAGFKLTIFTVLLGALGGAAGLALSGTLQNFTSGALILLLKPFHAGDSIVVQEKEGYISSIQMFYTIMTPPDDSLTIIPNSKLSNEIIVNTTACQNRKIEVKLKYKYSTDWAQVKMTLGQIIDTLSLKDLSANKSIKKLRRKIGIYLLEPDGYTVSVHVWAPSHKFSEYATLINEHLLGTLKEKQMLPGS